MKNLYQLKQIVLALAFTPLVISCGSNSEDQITSLKKEKDSLREKKTEISERMNTIEEELKRLDTSNQRNIPVVSVSEVKKAQFKHYFKVQGVVETEKNAEINADVIAKIMRIPFSEGSHVKKGQTILELDSRVLLNSIEELKTQIKLAETVYQKQKSLWDQNIGSEVQFLEAKTNKESLEAKLTTTYSQLEYYNIKAPFDGVIDEIMPKVGEMASPGIPLMRVLNLDKVYLKADISENYLDKIKVGDTAMISFPSVGVEMKSAILRIGNFINPNNRTFKVRFELKNKEKKLIPNLLASIEILDYTSDSEKFIVPTKLIQETPQGDEFLYILEENSSTKAKKVAVTTGVSYQGEVEILSGVSENDKVIVQGARGIKDGEIVSVVD